MRSRIVLTLQSFRQSGGFTDTLHCRILDARPSRMFRYDFTAVSAD